MDGFILLDPMMVPLLGALIIERTVEKILESPEWKAQTAEMVRLISQTPLEVPAPTAPSAGFTPGPGDACAEVHS